MSLNEVKLIGRLGDAPEIHTFNDGSKIANISLATSEHWTDNNGQKQERTEWHRVVIRGRAVNVVEKHVKKGMQVYISGTLKTRKYTDKNSGESRYITEIVTFNIQMLGSSNNNQQQPQQNQQQPQQNQPQQQKQAIADAQEAEAQRIPQQNSNIDDIPFD